MGQPARYYLPSLTIPSPRSATHTHTRVSSQCRTRVLLTKSSCSSCCMNCLQTHASATTRDVPTNCSPNRLLQHKLLFACVLELAVKRHNLWPEFPVVFLSIEKLIMMMTTAVLPDRNTEVSIHCWHNKREETSYAGIQGQLPPMPTHL